MILNIDWQNIFINHYLSLGYKDVEVKSVVDNGEEIYVNISMISPVQVESVNIDGFIIE